MLRKKKAFTMVETTIVIAILATLLGTLVPSFSHVLTNANKTSMAKTLSSSYDAIKMIDLKDGTMEYNNGLIFAKSKDSKQIYYAIVSNGNLSVTYTTSDKQRVSSIGNDYFCLPKCPGNYQAKIEENGVLKVYYNQDVENNISDQEEFVRTQAIHVVHGEENILDNAGNGGTVYDMATKTDLDGELLMSAKFVSTGKFAPEKIEFVSGVTNPLDFSLDHRYSYETTESTCTTGGEMRGTCIYCDKKDLKDLPPLGHDYTTHGKVNPTCTEKGTEEYRTCNRCGYVDGYLEIPALGHGYGTPTYTWDGVSSCTASVKCTRCTDTQTETSIPSKATKTAATCTEMGTSIYTASFTKTYNGNPLFYTQTKENKDIPELGHDWDSGVVTTAATCTTEGNKRYTCTVCSTTRDEAIPSNGSHTPVTDPAVAATCTSTGLTEGSHCSACGEILTAQETIAMTAHDYQTTKSATCVSTGTKTCSNCGATTNIPKLEHNYIYYSGYDATCTSDGWTDGYYCNRGCGYDESTRIEKLGHDFSVVQTAATCTEGGVTKCSRCSETETTDALGHSLSYFSGNPAECSLGGRTSGYYCTRCSYNTSSFIEPLGHDWNSGVVTKEATCQTTGEKKYTCQRCGIIKTETYSGDHKWTIIPDSPKNEAYCTICGEKVLHYI